jgi:predicted PurR-regulated permease PerM
VTSAEPSTDGRQPHQPGRSASDAVTWSVRVAAAWSWRIIVIVLALYLSLLAFEHLTLVVFAFVLALFFTAVLHPLESRLRRLGLHRSLASALVLIAGIVVFGLITWFVVVQITSHWSTLTDQVGKVADKIKNWLETGPFHLRRADIDHWLSNITTTLKQHQGQVVSGALTTARTVLEILGGLLLALFVTFFLLRDGDQVWRWVQKLIPSQARSRVDRAGRRGWFTLGGYVRGQVTIAVIHAVTVFLVLLILRIPLAAALGVLIFLGSFIPLLGLTISGALCVGIALLEHGAGAALVVGITIVVLFQAEGHLLQPLIMSRAVHIHPLAVALAVAAGTTLYGIIGALFAVPLVAFLNSFIRGLQEQPSDPVTEHKRVDSTELAAT